MKPILLVITHEGFQPIEYAEPKKALLDAGLEVKTANGPAAAAEFGKKIASIVF